MIYIYIFFKSRYVWYLNHESSIHRSPCMNSTGNHKFLTQPTKTGAYIDRSILSRKRSKIYYISVEHFLIYAFPQSSRSRTKSDYHFIMFLLPSSFKHFSQSGWQRSVSYIIVPESMLLLTLVLKHDSFCELYYF
jgi:hypothetical protein